MVFYISAVIYIIGVVVFALLAQGEPRAWVKPYLQQAPSDENNGSNALVAAETNGANELHDLKATSETGTEEEKAKLA